MELQQLYDAYFWQIFFGLILGAGLFMFMIYLVVKSKLLDKYIEFDDEPEAVDDEPKKGPVDEFIKSNCDECEHEPVTYRVGITNYATEDGARARCEGLYKRHNINAEVTLFFANESQLKCFALDIWDFNK